jgi:glycopeptide antibiotics resistance protein
MKFSRIRKDKWSHFLVGIGMGLFLQFFFLYLLNYSMFFASLLSFLVAVAISYGFEFYSLVSGKGHYEIMDALASVLGSMIGIAIVYLFR